MIGYSLSFCVRDILAGKMAEDKVTKIVTNTCCRTEADWEKLFEGYTEYYWRSFNKDDVRALLTRLREQGKIEQPRLDNPNYSHPVCSKSLEERE